MLIYYFQNLVVFSSAVFQVTLNAINYCVVGIKKYVFYEKEKTSNCGNFTVLDDVFLDIQFN